MRLLFDFEYDMQIKYLCHKEIQILVEDKINHIDDTVDRAFKSIRIEEAKQTEEYKKLQQEVQQVYKIKIQIMDKMVKISWGTKYKNKEKTMQLLEITYKKYCNKDHEIQNKISEFLQQY